MYRSHGGPCPPPRRQSRRGPHPPRSGLADRLVLVAATALAACNQTDNDRPETLEYITEAILAPSCSQYVCHSSYAMTKGYAFDTVAVSRRSLLLPGLVNASDASTSLLYTVLTRNVNRMPYDSPLASKNIDLIKRWIDDGAPGLTP